MMWITAAALTLLASPWLAPEVQSVPPDVRARYQLSDFYQRYADAAGIPVIGSAHVRGEALAEARFLIDRILDDLPRIRRLLIKHDYCFVVMAHDEMITDVPHFEHFTPKGKWDYTVRGVFSTVVGVASTCGEENLLEFRGDRRSDESVLIHELGHAIHAVLPTGYDQRVQSAYEAALAASLWKGTYAATNHREYWAEGFQCWYDANSEHDQQHNDVDTREELEAYDPALAALVESQIGRPRWRFKPPSQRTTNREHLNGFRPRTAPFFHFSNEVLERYTQFQQREAEFQRDLTLALQGDVPSQFNVGVALTAGRGIERDDEQAIAWLQKAVRKTYPPAQAQLGWMYREGRGVRRDYAKARRLFQKAAQKDDPDGQFRLGQMWREGQGVEVDLVQALLWLRLATAQGHEQAGVEFARLALEAEPDTLRSAQRLFAKRNAAGTRTPAVRAGVR